MTPMQKALVQASFKAILPVREPVATLFYSRLFELDPTLRPMFRGDMKEQGRKLMSMIGAAVAGLDRLDELVPTVQALGRRHAGYGVKVRHYATVGAALIWTLEQGLGEDFTPEVRAAWTECYNLVAGAMQAAASEPRAA